MRFYILTFFAFLIGCAPQYQYKLTPSPHDQIVQKCTETGYIDKELEDCIKLATDEYIKEFNKQTAINEKERIKAEKERIKAEKEAKARQLASDAEKCKDYGFKRGTKDFASCMMQIEQARKQEQQLQQVLVTQQEIANQQIEENKRAQNAQILQNYLLQQQAIQAQQNIANQNVLANIRKNNIDCSSYRMGNYVKTSCY